MNTEQQIFEDVLKRRRSVFQKDYLPEKIDDDLVRKIIDIKTYYQSRRSLPTSLLLG